MIFKSFSLIFLEDYYKKLYMNESMIYAFLTAKNILYEKRFGLRKKQLLVQLIAQLTEAARGLGVLA